MDAFHKNLVAKGKGAKGWANSFTEVEHLGGGKFAASIGVGHRVFFDKADGNKPKKHKITDERPAKDYVLIQSAKCCIEVYPHYAKYFDVNHEEVRLYEERWVVQRLFKEPDEWRDVDAYNPRMAVEEYPEPAGGVVKVTVTYDTDYGVLTVEYFQRDGNALKHNVAFKNTSGGGETFRVLQRWAGIVGSKVNGHQVTTSTTLKSSVFVFGDDVLPLRICESVGAIRQEGVRDVLEMLSGSREPFLGEVVLVEKGGLRLIARGIELHLELDEKIVVDSNEREISTMIRAVEDCPDNARVFIGGLGLGVVLFPLAISRKATEVIICEKDSRVIEVLAPLVQAWFKQKYPNLNLTVICGDAITEVGNHGNFDWIFMDINIPVPEERCVPYLTKRGRYTDWLNPEIQKATDNILYVQPVEVDIHPNGLKADFIYSNWYLTQGKSLIIDPDTYSRDDPTEDGYIRFEEGDIYTRFPLADLTYIGAYGSRGIWIYDYRSYVEWDISALAGASLSTNPIFKYEGVASLATDEEINPLTEEAPLGSTDANLYGYIESGTAYVDPWDCTVGANQSQDLGASAKTALQAAIDASQSWFALGFQSPDDEGYYEERISNFYSEDKTDAPTPKPTLYVKYSVGWTGKISGVTNPAKVMGVAVADIAEVKGVA